MKKMSHNKKGRLRKIFSLAILLCLIFAFQTLAQGPTGGVNFTDDPAMPTGIKGSRINAFITTINADNPARVHEFFEKHCTESFKNFAPMAQHIAIFQRIYQDTGGIDFLSIRSFLPERKNETTVIVKGRSLGTWRVNFMWDKEKGDFFINGLNFSVAGTAPPVDGPALSQEQFQQKLKELLKGLIEKDMFSGTFLIARGDEILMTLAGGEASKRFHVPNNIDTKFNLGSMNKMFTATAIMQLVEKGQLSLDDPINKYVNESWLPEQISSKITIHHLLSHTSGLGSYFNDTFIKGSRALFRNIDDFKPLVKDEKQAFEPGLRFLYSNTGMLLLGVVIESISGGSYFDYIRKNIYEPAGVHDSDSYEMDYPVENLAIGYSRDRNSPYGWQNNLYKHVIKGGPAGGGFSTVKDLHRFARAIQTGKLVSPESLVKMWKDQSGQNYGYGFVIENGLNGKVVGHGGGFPGINSELKIYLDKGYIVAVMSNYDGGATPLAQQVGQLLSQVR